MNGAVVVAVAGLGLFAQGCARTSPNLQIKRVEPFLPERLDHVAVVVGINCVEVAAVDPAVASAFSSCFQGSHRTEVGPGEAAILAVQLTIGGALYLVRAPDGSVELRGVQASRLPPPPLALGPHDSTGDYWINNDNGSFAVHWMQPDSHGCRRVAFRTPEGFAWQGEAECGPWLHTTFLGIEFVSATGPTTLEMTVSTAYRDSPVVMEVDNAPTCSAVLDGPEVHTLCGEGDTRTFHRFSIDGEELERWTFDGVRVLSKPGDSGFAIQRRRRVEGHPGSGCGTFRVPRGHRVLASHFRIMSCPAFLLVDRQRRLYVADMTPPRDLIVGLREWRDECLDSGVCGPRPTGR